MARADSAPSPSPTTAATPSPTVQPTATPAPTETPVPPPTEDAAGANAESTEEQNAERVASEEGGTAGAAEDTAAGDTTGDAMEEPTAIPLIDFTAEATDADIQAGVDVYLGASVTDLALDGAARAHEITLQGGDAPQALRARWVVDASGRAGLLAKRLDLRVPETEHRVGAAWGRYHGLRDMDDLSTPGASEWRARARHTSRVLSTNHFCYPGYWIWLIPLREGLTSVGVVAEASRWDRRLSRPARAGDDPLATFVRAHRGVGSLLEGAEQVDHGAFGQLSFRTKTFFSGERWGLVGDAAAFPDPFYSPGSDFIAIENDLLTDLIARDLAGEDVQERAQTYDAFMQMRFDTTLALYRGLYPTFGSYELFSAKCYFDTALYYNLLFDAYAADKHLDLRWLRAELRRRASSIATLEGYAERFAAAAREMHRRGTYYRRNLGHYELEGRKAFGVMQAVGEPRSRREVNERSAAVFARTDAMVRAALDDDTTGVPSLDAGGGADAWSRLDA